MTLHEKREAALEAARKLFDCQEVVAYLKTHRRDNTEIYFAGRYNCSKSVIQQLMDEYNIHKSVKEAQAARLATNMQKYGAGTKPRKPEIDKDLLQKWYITELVPIEEIVIRFGERYTKSQIRDALSRYGIKRDRRTNPNCKWSEESKAKKRATCLAKYGVSNAMQSSEVKRRAEATKVERYGECWYEAALEKAHDTYKSRTGLDNPFQDVDNVRAGVLRKYGVEHPSQVLAFRKKAADTKMARYGSSGYNNHEKAKATNLQRYGVAEIGCCTTVQEKVRATNLQRYEVEYTILTSQAGNKKRVHSAPNERFHKLLEDQGLVFERDFEREFALGRKVYDFRISSYLIEINPSSTHNSTWNPWIEGGIDMYYHQIKSKWAQDYGFRCVHIFDWDDPKAILQNILDGGVPLQVSFESPRPHYYSFKSRTPCSPTTPKCVCIYDDGALLPI